MLLFRIVIYLLFILAACEFIYSSFCWFYIDLILPLNVTSCFYSLVLIMSILFYLIELH